MTAPLTPSNCNLQDFARMMIDIPRLRGSEFDSTLDDGAWRAGLNLWMSSWHQVPAGSLPPDDANLAKLAGLGRDLKTWKKVRDVALRGWLPCDDGLLYHPVVSEMALEAWLEKLAQALSSGAGNAKRWGSEFDPAPVEAEIEACIALLANLNPRSKALAKASRRKAVGTPKRDPDGTEKPSRQDAKTVPSGSQETGTGTGNSSEGKPSADLFDLTDPAKLAWDMAIKLLTDRGTMKEPQARSFFGKLLRDNGLEARDLLPAISQAVANGTGDPQAYLVRAAKSVASRRTQPAKRVGFV